MLGEDSFWERWVFVRGGLTESKLLNTRWFMRLLLCNQTPQSLDPFCGSGGWPGNSALSVGGKGVGLAGRLTMTSLIWLALSWCCWAGTSVYLSLPRGRLGFLRAWQPPSKRVHVKRKETEVSLPPLRARAEKSQDYHFCYKFCTFPCIDQGSHVASPKVGEGREIPPLSVGETPAHREGINQW